MTFNVKGKKWGGLKLLHSIVYYMLLTGQGIKYIEIQITCTAL